MIITIPKKRDKFILLSDEGYILHTDNDFEAMKKWTSENFAGSLKEENIYNLYSDLYDFSTLYRDERGMFITEKQLDAEYEAMNADERNGRSFAEYLLNCMSINGGTLTVI